MYAWSKLGSTLKRTVISTAQKLSGSYPFSPKIPNFDFPTPKYVFKDCLQVHELKRAFKNTLNMKTNAISHNSSNQPISTKTINKFKPHHKSMIMNTQVMNHQQQYFIELDGKPPQNLQS